MRKFEIKALDPELIDSLLDDFAYIFLAILNVHKADPILEMTGLI